MRHNWREERPVVHLDETWANAHDGKTRAWLEKDPVTKGTIGEVQGFVINLYLLIIIFFNSKPSGKGECLIVLHAGGKDRFPVCQFC